MAIASVSNIQQGKRKRSLGGGSKPKGYTVKCVNKTSRKKRRRV